jgi:transcriptional regulator with XRE-family HTH domain
MSKNLQTLFGEAIRRRRERADLSQEQLGQAAGITRNYVGMVERGENAPTVVVLHQLAKALGTTMAEIVKEVEEAMAAQEGAPGEKQPDSTPD